MGVDIYFFKSKRSVYDQFKECEKNDQEPSPELYDQLNKDVVAYFRGRHFIWEQVTDICGSQQLVLFSKSDIDSIISECKDICERFRVYNDEFLSIPLDRLKNIVEEAEKYGKEYVTFELENRSESADLVEEDDYHEAKKFLDTNWECEDDEVVWMINSY